MPRRHKSHRLVSFPHKHSTLLYIRSSEIVLCLAFFEITTPQRHVALRVANIRVTTWTWIKHIRLRSLRPHLRLAIHSRCHQCGIHARRPQLITWIKACVLYVRVPSILERISYRLYYLRILEPTQSRFAGGISPPVFPFPKNESGLGTDGMPFAESSME